MLDNINKSVPVVAISGTVRKFYFSVKILIVFSKAN